MSQMNIPEHARGKSMIDLLIKAFREEPEVIERELRLRNPPKFVELIKQIAEENRKATSEELKEVVWLLEHGWDGEFTEILRFKTVA